MRMTDVGWIWEGQALDPGVHPSIFGVGEGAKFFGLRKVHFMFHPNTALALEKLHDMEEVVCDISKWCFRDCGADLRGSELYVENALDHVCAEAEKVSRFSLEYPNVTGGFFDDMKGLMDRHGHGREHVEQIAAALKKHNPNLKLESVVYSHELAACEFWQLLLPYIDVVSFWFWGYQRLKTIEADLERCRELFVSKPIRMGCYLRDYPSQSPMPMEAIRFQWQLLAQALEDGRVNGFDILGTVLIDGHLDQACWIRDFLRDHS